ncbi:MAG TPA: FAD-binding oxidoreductase [Acidimicrobiia bacterium]|nr:FAD-binding oxidoreductase [Acidimicrobiia bacterium]
MAKVVGIRAETARATTIRLALPQALAHRAGQHVVVRLSAPDGYTASRSYSIASAPDDGAEIELTIERLEDGEVSTFLHDELAIGDELEVRGPIGGWFVWDADTPALLLGGGSGVVPVMAMLRLARRLGRTDLLRLVVSVRAPGDLYYADEIAGPETTLVYTRAAPPAFPRAPARLTLADIPLPLAPELRAYVCGSSGFADAASAVVLAAGVPTEQIRVERFGPSG